MTKKRWKVQVQEIVWRDFDVEGFDYDEAYANATALLCDGYNEHGDSWITHEEVTEFDVEEYSDD